MCNHARRCKTRENSSRRQGSPERTLYEHSCLVGRCINSSWRHTRRRGKREKGVVPVFPARMFAYYYRQQIPPRRSGRSLQLQERQARVAESNIRMHWDVHPEVSRIRVLRKEPEHPTLFSSCSLFSPSSVRLAKQSLHKEREFNIFELLWREFSLLKKKRDRWSVDVRMYNSTIS